MKMFYLACPYSSDDDQVVSDRIFKFSRIDGALMATGHHTISPLYKHLIFENGVMLPSDWDYWAAYSKNLMARCDAVVIVCLPGWETSKGVLDEIEEAKSLGRPIFHLHPSFDEGYMSIDFSEKDNPPNIHAAHANVSWNLPL